MLSTITSKAVLILGRFSPERKAVLDAIADELRKELDVTKTQLNVWLKRAMDEGKLNKERSPVRYAWLSSRPRLRQATIF